MPRTMLDEPSGDSTLMDEDVFLSFKHPRHEWTSEHRVFLCVFSKVFSNGSDQGEIFSHCFKDVLRIEGFENGFPYTRIVAQLRDMRRIGAPGHEIFTDICLSKIKEVKKRFRAVRENIEDAALDLGIELRLRAVESQSFKVTPVKKQRQSDREGKNVLGDFAFSEEDIEATSIRPQSRRRKCHTPGHLLQTKRAKQRNVRPQAHFHSPRTPRVLFRFYDDASAGINGPSFRAGLFVDDKVPIPDPISGSQLKRHAITHLTPKKEPTPFISFSNNILPALHRAFKSGKNAFVAVVDFQSVVSSHRRYFRSNHEQSIHLVPILCKQMGFSFGKNKYVGYGEWLIYGFVDESSIVGRININELTRNSVQFAALSSVLQLDLLTSAKNSCGLRRKFRQRAQAINFEAGLTIGRVLSPLADEYKEIVATKIRRNFELVAGSPQAYEEYMNGVYSSNGVWRRRSISIHDTAQDEDADVSGPSESDHDLTQESNSDDLITGRSHSRVTTRAAKTVAVAYSEDWLRSPDPSHERSVSVISALDTFTKELLEEASKCTPAPTNNDESAAAEKAPQSRQAHKASTIRDSEGEGISPKRKNKTIDLIDEIREVELREMSPLKKRKTRLESMNPEYKALVRLSRSGSGACLDEDE